ncbi:MAG: DinB family protein [Acidobacteriota bacterium]
MASPKRIQRRTWFDREFELGLPVEAFPDVLERVRGTPARLEDRVGGVPEEMRTLQLGGGWSIQENVGHLIDLEPLWAGRLDDLNAGVDRLRGADLENRRTHGAGHNRRRIEDLLSEFRDERMATVKRLEELSFEDLHRSSLHPRLEQPMTVVDLFFFVAEHDDHHLARISDILREGS